MFAGVARLVDALPARDLLHPSGFFQQPSLGVVERVNELEPLRIPEPGVHCHAADCNDGARNGAANHAKL